MTKYCRIGIIFLLLLTLASGSEGRKKATKNRPKKDRPAQLSLEPQVKLDIAAMVRDQITQNVSNPEGAPAVTEGPAQKSGLSPETGNFPKSLAVALLAPGIILTFGLGFLGIRTLRVCLKKPVKNVKHLPRKQRDATPGGAGPDPANRAADETASAPLSMQRLEQSAEPTRTAGLAAATADSIRMIRTYAEQKQKNFRPNTLAKKLGVGRGELNLALRLREFQESQLQKEQVA